MTGISSPPAPEVIELPDARLLLWEQFLPRERCERLLAQWRSGLAWQQSRIRIAGVERPIPRLNAWYGDHEYRYSGVRFPPRPFPEALDALRRCVVQATGYCFNAALVNLYRDGRDSVAWHADDERELGNNPVVASVSLGATRTFRLRHNRTRQTLKLALASGMLLVMAGPMQHHWQHCLPKEPAVADDRLNVTFRCIVPAEQQHRGKAR